MRYKDTKEILKRRKEYEVARNNVKEDIQSLIIAKTDAINDEQRQKLQAEIDKLKPCENAFESHLLKLDREMQALPPQERLLLEARYYKGRQFEDIANELNLSKKWVRVKTSKALHHLANRLGGYVLLNTISHSPYCPYEVSP